MKFREHRRLLSNSMATVVELAGRPELLAHVRRLFSDYGPSFPDAALRVELYDSSFDERIGWMQTWIVTIDNYGVVGFTDGPAQF